MSKFLKYIGINDNAIELVDCQQLFYRFIYSLELIELEILKAYIKINLVNYFITSFKSPIDTLIFFDLKSNKYLRLYVNYRGLNNFKIKNWYLLPLVGELLDRLRKARPFTQLNLTSAYHWMRICKENVITWPSEWKSCDNYQPQLHLIRFDFHQPSGSPYLRHWVGGTVLPHLRHWVGGTSTYKSEGYSVRMHIRYDTRWQRRAGEWWQRPRRMIMNAI